MVLRLELYFWGWERLATLGVDSSLYELTIRNVWP